MIKSKKQPLWLDPLAKKYWASFANDVNLNDRYLYETLAQYCLYLSEYRRANDEIIRDGITVETKTTRKPHPALGVKNQAMTHIQRLSKILFTPEKDTGHIQVDELTDFFGGQS